AVHGGAVLCVRTSGSELIASPLPVHRRLAFVLATPGFMTSTAAARSVLPRMVTHGVATIAAARGAALVRGLETGDERLLEAALDDVLHVPHRRSLIRGYDEVTSAAVSAGAIGATLSGSGSTVLAITDRSRARAVAEAMRRAWQAVGVEAETFIDRCGTPGLAVDGGVAVRDILLASV
ncbi:MAG: homoserine kinase, partial [Gemmatimonadaceae bacterium]